MCPRTKEGPHWELEKIIIYRQACLDYSENSLNGLASQIRACLYNSCYLSGTRLKEILKNIEYINEIRYMDIDNIMRDAEIVVRGGPGDACALYKMLQIKAKTDPVYYLDEYFNDLKDKLIQKINNDYKDATRKGR